MSEYLVTFSAYDGWRLIEKVEWGSRIICSAPTFEELMRQAAISGLPGTMAIKLSQSPI